MQNSKTLQIEEMEPMRIARVVVECEGPEIAAFQALADWAQKNEPAPPPRTRFFGFNEPCPEPGQTVYAYEAWMTVSKDARGDGEVSVRVHPGGRYAVTTTPLPEIGAAWHRLASAVKAGGYEYGSGPALEEALANPIETPFDKAEIKLYFPIR